VIPLALGALAAGVLLPFGSPDTAEAQPDKARCVVEVRAENPYRNYGYDHMVNLKNTCEMAVECRVFTNVDKTPISVSVAPKTEAAVLVRRGAPSGAFTAWAECEEK